MKKSNNRKVQPRQPKPTKPYVSVQIGWVVGVIYPHDGEEWLLTKELQPQELHSKHNRRSAHLYKREQDAIDAVERAKQTTKWKVFYRPYFLGTFDPDQEWIKDMMKIVPINT